MMILGYILSGGFQPPAILRFPLRGKANLDAICIPSAEGGDP